MQYSIVGKMPEWQLFRQLSLNYAFFPATDPDNGMRDATCTMLFRAYLIVYIIAYKYLVFVSGLQFIIWILISD